MNILNQPISIEVSDGSRMQFNGPVKWGSSGMTEFYFRSYMVIDGKADMTLNGQHIPLVPNTFYLVPPRANVHHQCLDYLDIIWFHATITVCGCMDLFDLVDCQYVLETSDKSQAIDDMETVLGGVNGCSLSAGLSAYGTILRRLAPMVTPKDATAEFMKRITPAMEYMDENLCRTVTLAELARTTGYDRRYFCTLFKQVMGETPMHHFHRRRIDRARIMLLQTNRTIADIAMELGYSDAFHLSKTFKRMVGSSPKDYRKFASQGYWPGTDTDRKFDFRH